MSIDWGPIYRDAFPELVRFLHRKVWDAERARDLAQEVFVRALREEPDQPRAWLFHVAANLARDEARTVIRQRKHLTLLEGGADRQPPEDPHEALVRRERRDQVRAALERLGERDRDILLLWNAGFDYTEIAQKTGLAPSAVGTTLARARKRLVEASQTDETEERDHAAPR